MRKTDSCGRKKEKRKARYRGQTYRSIKNRSFWGWGWEVAPAGKIIKKKKLWHPPTASEKEYFACMILETQ